MRQNKLSGLRWVAFGLVLILAVPLALGCGSSYAKVQGKVKYKGDALPSGTINFIGKDGTDPGSGTIGDDGSYTVQAAPIGECTVTIVTDAEQPSNIGGKGTLDIMGGGGGQLKEAPKDPQKGKQGGGDDEKAKR